jgi:DNA (cytosine-5)-methyltransferase 1
MEHRTNTTANYPTNGNTHSRRERRLNFLDLFSGIGGFAYAAKLAGIPIENHYYSEIEKYPSQIYAQQFPEAVPLGDVRAIDYSKLPQGRWLVCGGFPCQDISTANTKAVGLSGSRSGLWWEYHRAIRELRPEYIIAENVPALTRLGLDRVLQSIAQVGYAAEWEVISARSVGAVHLRERIWIVAYPDVHASDAVDGASTETRTRRDVAELRQRHGSFNRHTVRFDKSRAEAERAFCGEPLVTRINDGLPHHLDRIKALGNAIVPQVAANIMERLELAV